jgi:hypothetical protein
VGGGGREIKRCERDIFTFSWSLPLYGFWLPPTAY